MCAYIKEGLSEILTVSIKLIIHSSKCDIICTCLPKCLMSEENCKKNVSQTPPSLYTLNFNNSTLYECPDDIGNDADSLNGACITKKWSQ